MSAKAFFRLYLPPIAFYALIFLLSSIPGDDFPQALPPVSSLLAHVCEFTLLAVLIMPLFAPPRRLRAAFATLALVGLLGLADELHQLLVPGRHCSLIDLGCDILGGVLGIWLHEKAAAWKGNRNKAK